MHEAIMKEVFEFSKPLMANPYTTFENYVADLEAIAKRFGGEVWNTGGHVMVAVLPVDQHYCIGVNDELVLLYHTEEAHASAYDIFWNGSDEEAEQNALYFEEEKH